MTVEATPLHPSRSAPDLAARAGTNARLLFMLGGALSFLAVGGRWDVALAAWVAPVILLRASRLMTAGASLGLFLALSTANALWWNVQLGVPLTAATAGFCVLLGIVFALPYAIDRLFAARGGVLARLFLFPVAVVVSEFAIATFSPLGASYGLRAITQSDNLALLQIIAVTGPYGIGFLVGWLATALNEFWDDASWAAARRRVLPVAAVLLAVVAGGEARRAFLAPEAGAPHVRIAGLTPSLEARTLANSALSGATFPPSAEARAATQTPEMQARYAAVQAELIDATRRAAQAGADIVVWSETAAPALAADVAALIERVAAVARADGVYVNAAVGVPFERNETHLVGPDGTRLWTFNKNHPVPGMEPVPPADSPVPVAQTPFGRLANVICFDADFPALTRVAADIMLVPGWDWPEIGRVHTLKMARLRAIENGYSLFRQDFIGQSAAFDYLGNTLATQDTTPGGAGHVMVADVPVRGVWTLYGSIGDVFAWLCVVALLAMGAAGIRSRRRA